MTATRAWAILPEPPDPSTFCFDKYYASIGEACAINPPTLLRGTNGQEFDLAGTVPGDLSTALLCGDLSCRYLGLNFQLHGGGLSVVSGCETVSAYESPGTYTRTVSAAAPGQCRVRYETTNLRSPGSWVIVNYLAMSGNVALGGSQSWMIAIEPELFHLSAVPVSGSPTPSAVYAVRAGADPTAAACVTSVDSSWLPQRIVPECVRLSSQFPGLGAYLPNATWTVFAFPSQPQGPLRSAATQWKNQTVTVAGADVSTDLDISTGELSATLETVPQQVAVGERFSLVMKVTNTSTASAAGATLSQVQPAGAIEQSGDGEVQLISGPSPASVASLAPGETVTFTWEYEATVDGAVGFNAAVSAMNRNGGTVTADATCALGETAVGFRPAGREPQSCSALGAAAVAIGSFALKLTPETEIPGKFVPSETIKLAIEAKGCVPQGKITILMDAPKGTTLVKGSSGGGKESGDSVRWDVDGDRVDVSFKVLVRDRKKLPRSFTQMKLGATARCAYGVKEKTDSADETLDLAQLSLRTTDASAANLSGLFLPDPKNAKRLPTFNWAGVQKLNGIAADGVAMALIRVTTEIRKHGKLKLSVMESLGAEPGSLWSVSDTSVIDNSVNGGERDRMDAGPAAIAVKADAIPGDKAQHQGFALYRAPRNFDASGTEALQSRKIKLVAELFDAKDAKVIASEELEVPVVRPLLILQHGTFDQPDGWLLSPLFTDTGNEIKGYDGFTEEFPFQTSRGNFSTYRGAAGDLRGSAPVAWAALNAAVDHWKRTLGYAAAQVDVVAHSYGGVNMRWITQSQFPGFGPTTLLTAGNFRNATNWGHGIFHKLITVATTHRGSAVSNQLAYLNYGGLKVGVIRAAAEVQQSWIDRGGVQDQMVVSPTLLEVRTTLVPGHAIVGSGLCDYNDGYATRLGTLYDADRLDGPFRSFGNPSPGGIANYVVLRQLSNYGFNLSQTLVDDTTQDPNYDLTVSSYSSQGGMPRRAQSTVVDLEAQSRYIPGTLVGRVTHGDEISSGGGLMGPEAVAKRVAFLLREPTTSQVFANFPAVAAQPLTPTEAQFSNPLYYDPRWLYLSNDGAAARARAAAGSTLTADPATTTVVPGQQLALTLTTPTVGVERVLTTWADATPGASNLRERAPGTSVFALTVPNRSPGPLRVAAFVIGTDGSFEAVYLDLEIVDPVPYTALRIDPPNLVLRTNEPGAFVVRGQLPSGAWRTLNASARLVLTSGDAGVATLSADRTVQPGTPGVTTVTATYDGGLTATLDVQVTGEVVPVAAAPRRKGKIRRRAKKPTEFVFLSTSDLDPSQIDQTTVRVGGQVPTKFSIARDYNDDQKPDLVAYVSPRALGLSKGPAAIGMIASLTSGPRLAGTAAATVR